MTRASPAAARARQALLADPRRTDTIIAVEAFTASQWVGRVRRAMEAAGTLEHVPVASRVQRARSWPLTPARKAIEALGEAATARDVMALSGCSYQAAWRALAREAARRAVTMVTAPADAAAAVCSISVDKSRQIVYGVKAERPPPGYYQPPDHIETTCPACTLEWAAGRWQHERSCLFRARPAGR
jgi:hypothetical protein